MKQAIRFFILVLSTALMLSCALGGEGGSGGGDLNLMLSSGSAGSADTARVYLLTTGDELVSIGGGTDYLDTAITGDETTITISGIPAGLEYQVFLALGKKAAGYFDTQRYGVSAAFTTSAGVDVEAPAITLNNSPFTKSGLMGKNIKDVVWDGSSLYAVDTSTLYGTSFASLVPQATLPAGYGANSISVSPFTISGGTILVNTDKGIVPFFGGSFVILPNGLIPVLDSGSFEVGAEQYIYYQRDGGLGGVKIGSWSWLDIDLSDVIAGQPVRDLVVVDEKDQAYFVTKLGTVRLTKAMIDDKSTDFLKGDYSSFVEIYSGGQYLPVLALDYSGGASGNFFLGTEDGVWTSTDPIVSSTRVPGTAGKNFRLVLALGTPSSGNFAALADHYLYIRWDGTLKVYPFHSGLPGAVSGMASDGTQLIIAGSEGLVALGL